MNKNVTLHKIPYGTDEWHEFRKRGIGSSEGGSLLGKDKYRKSRIRIYYEKLGMVPTWKEQNEAMFHGKNQEDYISRLWSFWAGTWESMIKNWNENNVIRKYRKVNGYLTNKKYPYLFVSIDRLMNIEGGLNFRTGEQLITEGNLELKTISSWEAKRWESGVPESYVIQVHIGMIICETNYSEIAIYRDGNRFNVEVIERDDNLVEEILLNVNDFWENKIIPGKEAATKMDKFDRKGDFKNAEEQDAIIQSLEPDPDDSTDYEEFMNQSFLCETPMMLGTIEAYNIAKRHKFILGLEEELGKYKQQAKNELIKIFKENAVEILNWDTAGKCTYKIPKSSSDRSFRNYIKEKPSPEFVRHELEKIEFRAF